MLEIEQVSNPAHRNLSPRSPRRLFIISDENNKNIENKVLFAYKIILHIFIFSIFESFFFWLYITDQEDKALEKQFNQIEMLSNLICRNIDIDLDPFYEYINNERIAYNNDVPLKNTFIINFYLLGIVSLFNCFFKIGQVDIIKNNCIILKEGCLIFIFLFIYEFLFFNTIIYNYKPKSIAEITKNLFNDC